MTETYCEVCGHLLVRPRNGGALCAACRTAGALFRRRWMGDLRAQGLPWRKVQEIVGTTEMSPRLVREAALR